MKINSFIPGPPEHPKSLPGTTKDDFLKAMAYVTKRSFGIFKKGECSLCSYLYVYSVLFCGLVTDDCLLVEFITSVDNGLFS